MQGPTQLVALMGLPGSGKSTLARTLAANLSCQAYLEPEEDRWPNLVKEHLAGRPDLCGTYLFFRTARVEGLSQATTAAQRDGVAVVDSYYDKLLFHYMDNEHLRWYFNGSTEAVELIRRAAALDYQMLPNATDIVFLEIGLDRWTRHLASRGRGMDQLEAVLRGHPLQLAMFVAAKLFCDEFGARLHLVSLSMTEGPDVAALLNSLRLP